ncbi:retrovirus-related Pol polyprotein from transposon 297 [Trichonephila clavipes]|nr:retrovirus-related Pol polyprotein from transposon 297 [Trichonephila clavipes]
MKSAFNQIPLHFADRHKTAFSTPDGDKYQFNRLCFGLKNSPKAFQSIAQEVLGDLLHHEALVYIDDIILFTKTIDEHFELLGCCNFYRRYIKNFAKRALPLTSLLRKDTPFEWTSETQEAFDDIKKAILNPPVLALPDQNAELQITTDASSRGIGAVLEQRYPNSEDQEASHVELSTRATKQHHYDYKIGSLCFIKTPNIKSNLSPKLRPKFEGPYRVIERFSNVNYRVQHVEQLRKRFNTHVNRMIPFIKRFSYLHLKNLDDLQPDETEVKGIVPSPRYNLRARAEEEFLGVPLTPPKRVTHFPRLEEGNVPINTSWYGMFLGISRVLGESWTARRYHSADSRPIRKADCVAKKNPLQNTEVNRREI